MTHPLSRQLSSPLCPPGLEEAARARRWADVRVRGDALASVGQRVFFAGEAGGREVTLMLTPETKVEAHHLLTPLPIAAFSHALSPTLLDARASDRGGAVQGEEGRGREERGKGGWRKGGGEEKDR